MASFLKINRQRKKFPYFREGVGGALACGSPHFRGVIVLAAWAAHILWRWSSRFFVNPVLFEGPGKNVLELVSRFVEQHGAAPCGLGTSGTSWRTRREVSPCSQHTAPLVKKNSWLRVSRYHSELLSRISFHVTVDPPDFFRRL